MDTPKSLPKNTPHPRYFYMDAIRAFACLAIIMIHVSAEFAVQELGTIEFWFGNVFDSISRVGVPLFVMISGALMLDEQYAYSMRKLKAHAFKLLCFYLFWSSAYALCFSVLSPLMKGKPISFINVAWDIVHGYYHLWFSPMMIGVYLLLPLLRLWVRKANMKQVEYFLLLALLFAGFLPQCFAILTCINPLFAKLNSLLERLYMHYPVGFSAYFVLGWYLNNKEFSIKASSYRIALALASAVTILGTYLLFRYTHTEQYVFYDNFSLNILVAAVAVFMLCKMRFSDAERISRPARALISVISKYSLGIYAVHAAVIAVVMRLFAGMHVLIMLPCAFIISAALSLAASFAISKIPFFKRFI